ncbi:MAG: septal ring lytic transglycosylase RlpA family protein, partial [Candidatus Omnitrophica bacterium]|nr:septal ring lytic transglycosylase RlpA family protein [Candidatus Omnitrophota bacterium]
MKRMLFIVLLMWFGLCESAGAKILDRPDIGVAGIFWGKASYYGRYFHGRKTASGARFDMYKLTAAHRQLPLGTKVRVTNLENGQSVIVVINDRGP